MKVRSYNVKVKGIEVEVEKIVITPITVVQTDQSRRVMWVGHVYSAVYDEPLYTTIPTLTASGATERAFVACIVTKHGEPT
ncbi:MAG TPA: hypothetical protein VGJ00_03870 [Rhabdochlamydiaceae bacterium]|jgi:hypothetical protein